MFIVGRKNSGNDGSCDHCSVSEDVTETSNKKPNLMKTSRFGQAQADLLSLESSSDSDESSEITFKDERTEEDEDEYRIDGAQSIEESKSDNNDTTEKLFLAKKKKSGHSVTPIKKPSKKLDLEVIM